MSESLTTDVAKPVVSRSRPPRPPPPPPIWSHRSYPEIVDLFTDLLPPAPHHLPILYHTPRRSSAPINRLILSVTPTASVYSQLTPRTAVFLHRPWALERRRLFPSNLVLTSHQRLDEILTTGYNLGLMSAIGTDVVPGNGEIIGYKGDPERKMGVVVKIPEALSARTTGEWKDILSREFDGLEGDNFADLSIPAEATTNAAQESTQEKDSVRPKYIACMNAFEPIIIDRLLHTLSEPLASLENPHDTPLHPSRPRDPVDASSIFYITGEPRPLGSETARSLRIPTIFVGHNRSEVWAIKWLAQKARESLGSGIEVIVVDEPEVVLPRPVKPTQRPGREGPKGNNGTREGQRDRKRKSAEGDNYPDRKEPASQSSINEFVGGSPVATG